LIRKSYIDGVHRTRKKRMKKEGEERDVGGKGLHLGLTKSTTRFLCIIPKYIRHQKPTITAVLVILAGVEGCALVTKASTGLILLYVDRSIAVFLVNIYTKAILWETIDYSTVS